MTRHSAAVAFVLAAALGAGGCASSMASSFSTGGAAVPVPPIALPAAEGIRVVADGGLFIGATIAISTAAANTIAVIGVVGLVAAGNDWSPLPPLRMRADRTINVQDCSKPIANWSANLKCASPEALRELERARRD
jgi:hypothetical protein